MLIKIKIRIRQQALDLLPSHMLSKFIQEPAIAFGKSIRGIDYDSLDEADAFIFSNMYASGWEYPS